jgi:hypothetical protein
MIKQSGIARTIQYCLNRQENSYRYGRDKHIHKNILLDFINDIEPFLSREVQTRSEYSIFSIYCKDQSLYNSMLKKLSSYISKVYEPSNAQELDYLMNNSAKKVMCNHLPYDTYQYRVYFKSSCDADTKRKFASWIGNYQEKVKIPKGTIKWIVNRWIQNPYIYVTDQSTLAMIGLFMGNNVSKVEEFILRSSINTCLDQDQTCQHLVSA